MVVAGLATASGAVVLASNLLGGPDAAAGARAATPVATASPASPTVDPQPSGGPTAEEPVGDPEDSPEVEVPSAEPTQPWRELPDPSPTPEPQEPAPSPTLPTLPPLAPYEPYDPAPTTDPAEPTDPSGPADPTDPATEPGGVAPGVPTLTGPPTGTPLTTFPRVSGVADPGVTVVLTTADGASLTSVVADGSGEWSAPVCPDAAAAPGACLVDTSTLTVQAHAEDDSTGLSSELSDAVTWEFERPTLTVVAAGGQVLAGDVEIRLEGAAGQRVELSIDGRATGQHELLPQSAPFVWRGAEAGMHALSVRYVTASGSSDGFAAYGPNRTSTVEVGSSPEPGVDLEPEPEPQPSAQESESSGEEPSNGPGEDAAAGEAAAGDRTLQAGTPEGTATDAAPHGSSPAAPAPAPDSRSPRAGAADDPVSSTEPPPTMDEQQQVPTERARSTTGPQRPDDAVPPSTEPHGETFGETR